MEPKITKLEIEMGEQTVPLTIEQARKLQAALNALFGDYVNSPTIVPYPVERWIPWRPHYMAPYWTLQYGSDSGTLTTCLAK